MTTAPPPPSAAGQPLAGRTIVTTRPEPGAVDEQLAHLGASVLHIPLVALVDPDDPAGFASTLDSWLGSIDPNANTTFVAVTSVEGARRVGPAVGEADVRLAAVGTATAQVLADLAGRPVDVIPTRHTAADLVVAFPPSQPGDRVIVAQADRAAPTLVEGLRDRGFAVDSIVAYRTELRVPDDAVVAAALAADAVVFASGSAATAWAAALGTRTPRHVIVIGPTTAAVAADHGLVVTTVASEHSVAGLVAAAVATLG